MVEFGKTEPAFSDPIIASKKLRTAEGFRISTNKNASKIKMATNYKFWTVISKIKLVF